MGRVVRLPVYDDDEELRRAIEELTNLLDHSPSLLRRSAEVTTGTAVPAHELLRPILRKLQRPLAALIAVGSASALLMVGTPDVPMQHEQSTAQPPHAASPVAIDKDQASKVARVTKPTSPPTPQANVPSPQADVPTVPPASAASATSPPTPTPATTAPPPVTNTLPVPVPAASVPAAPSPPSVPAPTAVPQVPPPPEPVEDVVKGTVRDTDVVP